MQIIAATLRRLNLPLIRPYRLSYRTFETFEPFVVELTSDTGQRSFADGHISPGSSSETRDGGWAFMLDHLARVIGQPCDDAKTQLLERFEESKVAATAIVCAIEALQGSALLRIEAASDLPLLAPLNATEAGAIEAEIDGRIGEGFATFKVKVGKDVDADLARVAIAQQAVAGRANLRLDANRAFTPAEALRFVGGLRADAIELFEQPCDAEDWAANAAVAAASPVPLMLDEPICTATDIARAAELPGVGYCKLKLKRFGSLQRLREGLELVRDLGMQPVLGDGLGSEIHNWMEACVARGVVDNAGEFNGFLKPKERLFATPLSFYDGAIHLPVGYAPQLDQDRLRRFTTECVRFGDAGADDANASENYRAAQS